MKIFKVLQACLASMMLILSVFLITGCGSSDEAALVTAQVVHVLPGACTEAGPKVDLSTPADNTVDVPILTTITAYFSEAMDPATIAYTDQGDPQVIAFTLRDKQDVANTEGKVAYDAPTMTATFTPTIALHGDSWYIATVTTYASAADGTSLGCNYQWEFKTVAP
jgi:hypothetical protein